MIANVYVEPHERYDAIDTYKDRLRPDQVEQIEEAPETAIILIQFGEGPTVVTVIEEG